VCRHGLHSFAALTNGAPLNEFGFAVHALEVAPICG
jgi:hypothetical protein